MKVENLTNGRIQIDFTKSEFVQQGLRREHVGVDPEGFTVTIPEGVRSSEYQYIVQLNCGQDPASCPSGTFYVPVKNDDDQILETIPKTTPAPVFAKETLMSVELRPANASYEVRKVRLVPGPEHEALGLSFSFVQYLKRGQASLIESIARITSGTIQAQHIAVNRTDAWQAIWSYTRCCVSARTSIRPIRTAPPPCIGRLIGMTSKL